MGGGSGKLVKFQQHTRKKPEDEKTQLNLSDISLPDHLPLGWCHVTAQFRRIMGTFGGIFGNFFLLFSQNFLENFGQQVRVVNQSKKLVQYLLSMFRFSGFSIRSQLLKNFGIVKKFQVN